MIDQETIDALAERNAPDRCFVSAYVNDDDLARLEERLAGDDLLAKPTELELENLEPTFEMIREWFDNNSFDSRAVGLFACWADDYLEAVPVDVPVERQVVVDSSPYVLPLAEVADEYENWCIVLADHDGTGIFEVGGLDIDTVDRVAGDIKNSVQVGGWSQQRYERRRQKQISHYCDEIADRLDELVDRNACDRIVLAGDQNLVAKLEDELPNRLRDRVVGAEKLRRDLTKSEIFDELEDTYEEAERTSERELAEQIQKRRYRDGRAAIGADSTLEALQQGRVQTLLVERDREIPGSRCRTCETLFAEVLDACPACDGDTFEVDLANEFVEMVSQTDAEVDVADPMDQLTEWGGVAALLRY
jgi:peptide chain release factor subunit 1